MSHVDAMQAGVKTDIKLCVIELILCRGKFNFCDNKIIPCETVSGYYGQFTPALTLRNGFNYFPYTTYRAQMRNEESLAFRPTSSLVSKNARLIS